ncbi:MAG: hypothetical protein FWD67_01150 [Betaproteobacteria bacterium]|nr:hypothetical protein [Betaproteobacteria bacterium]
MPSGIRVLLLLGTITMAAHSTACRAEDAPALPASENNAQGVVNWTPPTKRALVERALSDGMTDPARMVEWARNYNVTLTVAEVLRIKECLAHPAEPCADTPASDQTR